MQEDQRVSWNTSKLGATAMSTPTEPSRSREHTGTYFVQDRGNVEEL
jgi:hypothetical protein